MNTLNSLRSFTLTQKLAKLMGWEQVGGGTGGGFNSNGTVHALAFDSAGNLYAGGYFTSANKSGTPNTIPCYYIAKYIN